MQCHCARMKSTFGTGITSSITNTVRINITHYPGYSANAGRGWTYNHEMRTTRGGRSKYSTCVSAAPGSKFLLVLSDTTESRLQPKTHRIRSIETWCTRCPRKGWCRRLPQAQSCSCTDSTSRTPRSTDRRCSRSPHTSWCWRWRSGCSRRRTRSRSRTPRSTGKPSTRLPRTPRSWRRRWECSRPGTQWSCSRTSVPRAGKNKRKMNIAPS